MKDPDGCTGTYTHNVHIYCTYYTCTCNYLRLSAGDLELNVNSDGVEGMERTDASGLGGSWDREGNNVVCVCHSKKKYGFTCTVHVHYCSHTCTSI